MEIYDAFSQGVKPGGLRSRNEIKILICYIICKIDSGITKEQLNEILSSEGLANYFEVNQALSEVIKNGNVRVELSDKGEEILYPSDLGKSNTYELEDELPYTVKKSALNAAVALMTKLKRERENKIDITPHGNGYDVSISIMDNDDKLLSVTMFAADSAQADHIKNKFLNDPVKMYSTIVALLMA